MNRFVKLVGVVALAAAISVAQANFSYNIIHSSVFRIPSMTFGTVGFVTSGPNNNFVDHLTGAAGAIVGTSLPNSAAIVTIIYEVDTMGKGPVNAVNISILGTLFGGGRISWSEVVEDNNGNVLTTMSNTFLGGAYPGGSNSAFTYTASFGFAPVHKFKVKKTFVLDIGAAPVPSLAVLSLVEQNWVPEPASMVALGVGLAGLALRRRRRK